MAGAGDGARGAGSQRELTHGVVAGVGDVELVATEGQSLRMTKARRVTVAVAGGAVAERAVDAKVRAVLVQRADEDAVVSAIGDGEATSVERDLAGKGEVAGRDRRCVRVEVQRTFDERA